MPSLSHDGCLSRQDRLRKRLASLGLDAALLTEAPHVMWLTNHIGRVVFSSAVLVPVEGPVVLSAFGADEEEAYADQVVAYEYGQLGTLRDDQVAASLLPLVSQVKAFKRVGCDGAPRPWMLAGPELVDLNPTLASLRRAKDADEVEMIQHAIRGCEAGYVAARQFVKPGVTEVQVFAHFQAAAVEAVGEPIGELGNDFRSGEPGGPPRVRFIKQGETYPIDVSVVYRGYRCDLCRTLAVGGDPSPAQREAHALVLRALDHVERTAVAGSSCKQLYNDVLKMVQVKEGWKCTHHLGHGIGVYCHESPRLNPHWDDTLQVGDVFTVEPGIYGEDLVGGVRVEQNYLVTDSGLKRLSNHDTSL